MERIVKIFMVLIAILTMTSQVIFASEVKGYINKDKILPYISAIESPAVDGKTELKGKVQIKGWYIYGKSIKKIEVFVDNQYVGKADRFARTDLAVKYSKYDLSKAGFSYTLDTEKINSKGMHLITIRATAEDGKVDEKEFNINLGKVVLGFDSKIETPTAQTISGKMKVSGWFVYKEPIDKIEILVDGKSMGTATRSARQDLARTHSGYDLSKAGYSYVLDTRKLTEGKHQIKILAHLANGKKEADWKDVVVNNKSNISNTLPYVSAIEAPATNGKTELKGQVKISGWYAYGKPIKTIEVLLDNQYIGLATRYARTDIAAKYPRYDLSQAGFLYTLDTDKVNKKGMHLITIRATAEDGQVDEKEFNINLGKSVLGFDSKIESPKEQIISGKVQVSGWFVCKEPIVKIEILVDDQYMGKATRSARQDLASTHSGYDLSKAGYSYTLDTRNLTEGKHQIKVMAYLKDGQKEVDWKDVTVSNEGHTFIVNKGK